MKSKLWIFIIYFFALNYTMGCATWKTPIRKECKKIVRENTYKRDVFDCKQFAPLTEEVLLKMGYDVEAVAGWYTFTGTPFISGKHAWVRLIWNGKKYAIDTSGERLIFQKEGYSVYNFHNYEVIRTLKKDKIVHKWVYE